MKCFFQNCSNLSSQTLCYGMASPMPIYVPHLAHPNKWALLDITPWHHTRQYNMLMDDHQLSNITKIGEKKNIEWAWLFHTIIIMRIRLEFFGISFFFLKNACSACQKCEWCSHAQWLVYLVGALGIPIVFTMDVALGIHLEELCNHNLQTKKRMSWTILQ
jgi:hypothetical protein